MALLLIDVQRAFFDGSAAPPVHDAEALLDRIAGVLSRARAAGVPIIHVQHTEPEDPLFAPGSTGWQLHPAVTPHGGEPVVEKRTPDAFLDTDLAALLDRSETRDLVIAGNQTEFCVDTTCRRARSLGYDVTLLSDGHSTWDSGDLTAAQIIDHHNRVLEGGQFVRLAQAAAVELR